MNIRNLSFASWLLAHRRSVLFLMTLLVAGGIYTALRMPVSLFPAISFPRVEVYLDSGNRPASQMELEVTRKVERALRGVPKVTHISSSTSRGSADVDVRFNWGTNMPRAVLQVQAALNQVLPKLPKGTSFQVHRMDPTKFPVLAYSLTSKHLSQVKLRDIARYQLVPLLSSVSGVRRIGVMGGKTAEYRVTVEPARLAALGLSMHDVERALTAANIIRAVGRLQSHDKLFLLLSDTRFKNLAEIRHTVLRTGKNGVVTLGDVATVRLATKPKWVTVTANGQHAVLVTVYQQLGGNTVAIDHAIQKRLKSVEGRLPPQLHIHQWYNQSRLILSSAGSVRDAIILGVLFATLVLFIFLRNWKLTLIALLVVPGVLASASALLYALGMSFNIMTLGGMAAAVGLIIDDVIVMLEHLVRRFIQQGHGPSTVLDAAREFTQPLAGSSTATVIIFVPLAFLSGVTGAFFKALALTMATSLIISFLFAWLALPLIAARLLSPKDAEHEAGGRITQALQTGYRRLMLLLLRRPLWLLAGLLPLLIIGALAFEQVPSGFMPKMNEGGFVLDYQTPPGTSLAETDRLLHQVAHILRTTPDVDTWSRRTGTQLGGGVTEANQGDFFVHLKSSRGQQAAMNSIAKRIHKNIPGLTVLDMNQPMQDLLGDLTGSPRPVVIRLFGNNWHQLVKLAPKIAQRIGKIQGLKEIQDGLVIAGDALKIRVERTKAALEGLTPAQVTAQLQAYLKGVVTTHIQQGQKIIGVRVWTSKNLRSSRQRIKHLLLRAPGGRLVPLSRIATVKRETGVPQITRYDLKPMVAVSARIAGRGYGGVISQVRKILSKPGVLPKNVYYTLGGLYKQQQIAFHALSIVFMTAAGLLFLALLFQYEYFRVAIAIISAPLLAVAGVFIGLWVSGQTLNITALMGMTMILGIVTEVAIFYFSELVLLSRSLPARDALIEAGVNRLRPIAMTTLAAILALLPLALGIGQGSAMQQPLAIAIISGLIIQMPLVLVAVPILFTKVLRARPEELLS
ncbi:efflux RND transporter permease subunit [Acidihalobacter prosperus]